MHYEKHFPVIEVTVTAVWNSSIPGLIYERFLIAVCSFGLLLVALIVFSSFLFFFLTYLCFSAAVTGLALYFVSLDVLHV